MPFTLAHPAAVLPLRGIGLPMTPMVVGAMVPDLPVFVGSHDARSFSHSALGVVTIDLAVGMLGLLLWYVFYGRPFVDMAPDRWRTRLPERVRISPRTWLLAVPAVIVGSTTHVVWDSFTHEDAWGVRHVTALREEFQGMAGYEWAQHVCSVLGLAVVGFVAVRYVSMLPEQPARPGPLVARWAFVVVLTGGLLLGLWIAVLVTSWGVEAMVYYGVITAMLVAGVGASAVCAWWHLKRRLRTPARQDA